MELRHGIDCGSEILLFEVNSLLTEPPKMVILGILVKKISVKRTLFFFFLIHVLFISKKFSFKEGQASLKKQEGAKEEGDTEAKEGTVESGEAGGRGKPQGMVDPQGSRNLSGSEGGTKVKILGLAKQHMGENMEL